MIIKNYTDKKVIDYLKTGNYKNVLFKFHHGLGDAVMWQALFHKLKSMFPAINMKQHLHLGQGDLFESATSDKEQDYDIIFDIGFPMNDHVCDKYTKAEYCCVMELGIEPYSALIKFNRTLPSPIVGVHFFSTCVPEAYSCPENIAHKIWDSILEANLIPLDTHMKHQYNNPKNKKFDWNTCSIDCAKADAVKLISLIQRCTGFCGVSSGNFNLATMVLPIDKLLFLENKAPLGQISKINALSVNVKKYDQGIVDEWIRRVKSND